MSTFNSAARLKSTGYCFVFTMIVPGKTKQKAKLL